MAGPWAGFHGVLLAGVGVLMLLFPPVVSHPRAWWLLALAFVAGGTASFLPAEWFGFPEWRKKLEALGLETGDQVVIQTSMAAEMLGMFAVMLLGGMWLAGHRASSAQLRIWAFLFTLGVAGYAVLAKVMQEAGWLALPGHFGFFPNRNHTATYLAMGGVCGLGCVLQALRDKRFVMLAASLAAASVCLWALAAWSVSRAGVVLIAIGLLFWLPMLGRRYLGRHGLWAIGLIILTAVGFFFTTDSAVRERLSETVEKAGEVIAPEIAPGSEKVAMDSSQDLDFRIPTFLDTLEMIGRFPWTGIGAGQYYYVFPQYRQRTIIAQDADSYHPESDWLWMAAETGVPAAFALLALVILAFWKSLKGVLAGRDRALRSACLVAAVLVPIHGLFDVPGHRITLAWSATFLFALSLHAPTASRQSMLSRPWLFRVAAFALMIPAILLIRAQWFGGTQPAVTTASVALEQAKTLYQQDLVLQGDAESKGLPYQPDPKDDKLEHALTILEMAAKNNPLNRDLRRYEAFLAFQFDDKFDRIDRAFVIDRALDPGWIAGPLRQAESLASFDSEKSIELCREAMARARQVDRMDSNHHWGSEKTLERIRQKMKGKAALNEFLKNP